VRDSAKWNRPSSGSICLSITDKKGEELDIAPLLAQLKMSPHDKAAVLMAAYEVLNNDETVALRKALRGAILELIGEHQAALAP
jgi:hypothetical protein